MPLVVYILDPGTHIIVLTRENYLELDKCNGSPKNITANTDFNIHSFGFELGYQFIFWDRLALDLVMVGPGMGIYNVNAKFDSNLTRRKRTVATGTYRCA